MQQKSRLKKGKNILMFIDFKVIHLICLFLYQNIWQLCNGCDEIRFLGVCVCYSIVR